jgi:predicted nucleotidyltransferase
MNDLILKLGSKISSMLLEHLSDKVVSVCLFGSAVRGGLRKGSDIDFLVVLADDPSSYHKRVKSIIHLLEGIRESQEYGKIENLDLDLEPSFLIMKKMEVETHPNILIDISHEGIILFDKEDYLKKHLNEIKEKMVKLGSIKKITPHGHYWVLKPDLRPGEVFEL